MAINVFQEVANRLINNPHSISPIAAGGGPELLRALNDDSMRYPNLNLVHDGLAEIISAIGGDDLGTIFNQVRSSVTSANPLNLLRGILDVPVKLPSIVESLLAHQVEVAASLLSAVKAIVVRQASANPAKALEMAYGAYFFDGGYVTVPNKRIAPPDLPPDVSTVNDLQSFYSQKTGERYVRDLVRLGIEAIANDHWNLIARYSAIDTSAFLTDKEKAKKWFAGFADYAESSATSAVEQAVQGIATFQTNALVAASVATAAGTAARKAAQATFFMAVGIDL